MDTTDYITALNQTFQCGNATEYTYRSALETLIKTLDESLALTNEPKGQSGNKPDFSVTQQRSGVPLGFIETKDIGKDLDSTDYDEQFTRYKTALGHIIITDYLRFQFWRNSEKLYDISIGQKNGKIIVALKENFAEFESVIKEFFRHHNKTIKTSDELASAMACKATLLKHIIADAIREVQEDAEDSSSLRIHSLIANFKEILIPDITSNMFADIYAQTIVYGLFVAGLYYRGSNTFTRKEARDSIPSLNPFLKRIFSDIAEEGFDHRIVWVIDDICELFGAVDFNTVMRNFDAANADNGEDPVVHFYEGFLAKYDPKERKKRGVFCTPLPVVQYLVRAVDEILKDDFGLLDGLADNSKVFIKQEGKNLETHKLHILDPATGTGTFLAEIVKHIYEYQKTKSQLGNWQKYVNEGLLPRLHGFEILMASYAIAHLKLDMILEGTGYRFEDQKRLGIFLTNSLEEGKQDQIVGERWLVDEANRANRVKQKTPVMVVIGNPPYKGGSPYNKGKWILNEIKEYKKGLGETKINLNNDYVKFIRLAQHYIDQNGEGVVAYISSNSFLDGLTFRQMRKSLLQSFDKIYIINLHGYVGIGETAPDGGKDENVFKIKDAGTSINIFVKLPKKKNIPKEGVVFADVFYTDVYGTRQEKFTWLRDHHHKNSNLKKLSPVASDFFFVPRKSKEKKEYHKGFSVTDLFLTYNSGIKTDRDTLFVDFERKALEKRIKTLLSGKLPESFADEYRVQDSSSYKITEDIRGASFDADLVQRIQYRPFDFRYIYYDPQIISRPAAKVMQHFLHEEENVGLIATRQFGGRKHFISFVTKTLIEISSQPYAPYTVFPLYTYNDIDNERLPNLSPNIVSKIANILGYEPPPEEMFDYVYAVLHSPQYREEYSEFLISHFPEIPYPESADKFTLLGAIGTKLRRLHLLETIPPIQTTFLVAGNNIIDKYHYHDNRIYINKEQYIGDVPESVWEFFVGGYQVLQHYLKYRKGRELDIAHYQNIIAVLIETENIMQEIDTVP